MYVIQKRARNRKEGVKELPRSNIYEAGAASIAELFGSYIEEAGVGGPCIVLVLSALSLGRAERDAVEKSFAALGYGRYACTYATLSPEGENGATLDPQALFLLVEGLDPLCVAATDATTVQALGQAYRTEFATDSGIRVFGRPSVAFRNLASLLDTDAGKQKAWRIFKSIPKR